MYYLLLKKLNKKLVIIIGFLFVLIGAVIIYCYCSSKIIEKNIEEKSIERFYSNNKKTGRNEDISDSKIDNNVINYIGVIKIPKINLEKGFTAKDDKNNDVEKGIKILEKSDYPNKDKGNVILASHSGTASISYFKNLYKLSNGDEVLIIYNGNTYNYKVSSKYKIDKTGYAKIKRDNSKRTLTLITCEGDDKQIVVICELDCIV